jgi:hypothetical protein
MIAQELTRAMNAYRRKWLRLHPVGVAPRMARYVRDATQLASNPYIDDFDMAQLYNEAYWGIGHKRRRRGSLRRGGRPGRPHRPHRPRPHFRPRHFRRRFRRFPRHFRPIVYAPSFDDTRIIVLRNLARKIKILWNRLPNKRKWTRSVVPQMRNPSLFFSRYPIP